MNWLIILITALSTAAEWRMGEFNAQELANTAWAFATAGEEDASLFAALATAAEHHMDDFNAQELANTAWALTDSVRSDAKELSKRSPRGGRWGGWVDVIFGTKGCAS